MYDSATEVVISLTHEILRFHEKRALHFGYLHSVRYTKYFSFFFSKEKEGKEKVWEGEAEHRIKTFVSYTN
jgi:hypothetical protein